MVDDTKRHIITNAENLYKYLEDEKIDIAVCMCARSNRNRLDRLE